MSRCFPYPPPGYVRKPAAAAEAEATTKLQKERENAEKKKEKRNDKKALQQGGETSKHSKRTHKKRKHEDMCVAGQESRKTSKESVEQLEKSGLSEEHGTPCFIQTVHDSPQSSQDSNKRRKVVLPSSCQNKNGNILRFKIKRDQDSPAAMLEKPRALEQPPVQQMGSGSSLLSKQNAVQPHHNKEMFKSAAPLQRNIKGGSQAVPKQVSTQPPARFIQRVDPQTTAKGIQKVEPQLSVKAAMGRVDHPPVKMMGSVDPSRAKVIGIADPSPAKVAQRVDPPPAKLLQRVDPPMSSKVIQRDAPPSFSKVLQKEISTAAFGQRQVEHPPLLQKPKVLRLSSSTNPAHAPVAAAASPPNAGSMRAVARAASLLRRAALRPPLSAGGPLPAKNLPTVCFNGYSTLLAPANEVLIPPELLSSKTVWTPDRELGQYEDLLARVTNFHNEDKGFMVLDGGVFDVPIRKDIVHRVVRWQLAKRQQGTHSTKTISEVSGTGRKPYKQKGTGRARHGTLRGPQFRGGATMHGPKPRSHAIKLQKKVRRLGLKIALSARTAEGKLLVFEDLEVPSHKTKNIVQYISQMDDTKKVLLVDGGDIDKKLKLATQNLHYVNVLPSIGLNVYSILQHDTLVMTRDAINRIVERMHTPINR